MTAASSTSSEISSIEADSPVRAGLVLLLALACAGSTPSRESREPSRAAYDRALSAGAGDPAAAEAALDAFLETHPRSRSPTTPGCAWHAWPSTPATQRSPSSDCAACWGAIPAVTSPTPRASRWPGCSSRAVSRRRLERWRGSCALAARCTRATRCPPTAGGPRRGRGVAGRASALARAGPCLDQPSPEAARAVDAEIDAAIAGIDPASLESVAAQLGSRVPAARVRARLARVLAEDGRVEDARDQLALANRLPLTPAGAAAIREAELVVGRGPGQDGMPGARATLTPLGLDPSGTRAILGAVLPLSGPYPLRAGDTEWWISRARAVRRRARLRSGIQLEMRDLAEIPSARPQRWRAGPVRQLLAMGRRRASAPSEPLPVAEAHGVRFFTLTRREDVAALGSSVSPRRTREAEAWPSTPPAPGAAARALSGRRLRPGPARDLLGRRGSARRRDRGSGALRGRCHPVRPRSAG